jgi:hypothetical protein
MMTTSREGVIPPEVPIKPVPKEGGEETDSRSDISATVPLPEEPQIDEPPPESTTSIVTDRVRLGLAGSHWAPKNVEDNPPTSPTA